MTTDGETLKTQMETIANSAAFTENQVSEHIHTFFITVRIIWLMSNWVPIYGGMGCSAIYSFSIGRESPTTCRLCLFGQDINTNLTTIHTTKSRAVDLGRVFQS